MSTILNSTRSQRTVEEKESIECAIVEIKLNVRLAEKCLKTAVVFEVTLQTEETQYQYIGLTEYTFKARYNAHKSSFNNENQHRIVEESLGVERATYSIQFEMDYLQTRPAIQRWNKSL